MKLQERVKLGEKIANGDTIASIDLMVFVVWNYLARYGKLSINSMLRMMRTDVRTALARNDGEERL